MARTSAADKKTPVKKTPLKKSIKPLKKTTDKKTPVKKTQKATPAKKAAGKKK